MSDECAEMGVQCLMRDCRFSDVDFEKMAMLWESDRFDSGNLPKLRSSAMKAPTLPALDQQANLDNMPARVTEERYAYNLPDWAQKV